MTKWQYSNPVEIFLKCNNQPTDSDCRNDAKKCTRKNWDATTAPTWSASVPASAPLWHPRCGLRRIARGPQKLQQQQQRALGKNSKNFYKNSLRRIMTGFRNLIGQWLPMQFENTLWSRLTVVIWRRAGTQSNAAQDLLFCAATKRGKWCTGFGLRRLEMRSPSNMHCSGCTNKQLMLFVNFCGWWPFIMEGDKTLLTSQCTAIASHAVIVNFLEIGSDKSNGWG